MAIWRWTGERFKPTPFDTDHLQADAYLYCPGPSLREVNDQDVHVPGAVSFVMNTAYPHIRPDYWVGLDTVECYPRQLWWEPFVKFCRGPYKNMVCEGRYVKTLPNVYFVDTKAPPQDEPYKLILDRCDKFTWHRHTLMFALDLMIFMGAKKIHFVGCDMGGNYYDGRELSEEHREGNARLYQQQVASVAKLNKLLPRLGVSLVSCTEGSPLNEHMPYVPLLSALEQSRVTPRDTKLYEPEPAEAVQKRAQRLMHEVAVVVPTRGDRSHFMDQCRRMIHRQTHQPAAVYIVDRAPTKATKDQRERVIEGVARAKEAGLHRVLIMEDDDYYRKDYIETMRYLWPPNVDLVGSDFYSLYHLPTGKRATYSGDQLSKSTGVRGSPLHATGFTIECWDRFLASGYLGTRNNLDDDLWAWANDTNVVRKLFEIPNLVISMKHNVGMCAGGRHAETTWEARTYIQDDEKRSWLSEHTDPEFHDFYLNGGWADYKPDDLTELATNYGTDKSTVCEVMPAHGYTPTYNMFFGPLRSKVRNVLEVGIRGHVLGEGDNATFVRSSDPSYMPSLYMWRDYFPNAEIHGVDILSGTDTSRVRTFIADQMKLEAWQNLDRELASRYDIIVDDGNHVTEAHETALFWLWPRLAPGGYYCIEDLNTPAARATRAAVQQVKKGKPWKSQLFPKGLPQMAVVHSTKELVIFQKKANPRLLVYTALFGERDNKIEDPVNVPDDITFRCYTDRDDIHSSRWEIVRLPKNQGCPRRRSRIYKMHPHYYAYGYEKSLWIDACWQVCGNLERFGIPGQEVNNEFPAGFHDKFSTTGRKGSTLGDIEARTMELVQTVFPDQAGRLAAQRERYYAEGLPRDFYLQGSYLVRRHNDPRVIAAMKLWWEEFQNGSPIDEISLSYAVWKSGLPFRKFIYVPKWIKSIRKHTGGPGFGFTS